MKSINQLSKKVNELERTDKDQEAARIILYDPVVGAPVIPEDNSNNVIFLIPDNRRDII